MLEKLLKLYVMATTVGVTSPTPHLFGPPGSGKSTVCQQAADLLGVNLHVVNVSRISPLALEGDDVVNETRDKLNLILARMWAELKDGDILLLDEFLRGFPEVYNGLLDILTSRAVAGRQLPNVFIVAASNSTVAYDAALEDRLLHIPVADPRKSKLERERLQKLFVDSLGLSPQMATSYEVEQLFEQEVLPTFEVLDSLGKGSSRKKQTLGAGLAEGSSLRHLIGQAQLREVHSSELKEVLDTNNRKALRDSKPQYVFLYSGRETYIEDYTKTTDILEEAALNNRLNPLQLQNYQLNLQLIELEAAKNIEREKERTTNEPIFD